MRRWPRKRAFRRGFEKYFAGPSSPRGTAIAALCNEFDLSADWMMFGKVDTVAADDHLVLMLLHRDAMLGLVRDLRMDTELDKLFVPADPSNIEWTTYFNQLIRQPSLEFMKQFRAAKGTQIYIGPSVPLFPDQKRSSA